MESFNEDQKKASEKIKGGENVLIFGSGGSGKSYLINSIKDDKTLCLAPTGMAAINMNKDAQTIHSIFKIGPKSLKAWNWIAVKDPIEKNKVMIKEVLDKYERIVFDEGSMIISGLFDTIVNTFHLVYNTDATKPFAGKQIIFMLDPLQLPCVKNSIHPYLDLNNLNYTSKELGRTDYIINNPTFKSLFNKELGNIIEFKGNERCKDNQWCSVLSACRVGFKGYSKQKTSQLLNILNSRRIGALDCCEECDENYNVMDDVFDMIETISSGNDKHEIAKKYKENTKTTLKKNTVQKINNERIQQLEDKGEKKYVISRKEKNTKRQFVKDKKNIFPNPGSLYDHAINFMDDLGGYYSLKEDTGFQLDMSIIKGERVMLRSNGVHPNLRNGSLGIIEEIIPNDLEEVSKIMVRFDDLPNNIIPVQEIIFEHPDISEIKINAFPLIPAFAITIHKLQGQTINSPLFIDYNDIPYKEKMYHLLYTAIGRCRKKGDVYIISDTELTAGHFPVDPIMYQWYVDHRN
jgi:hypothetical protein